MTDIVLNPSEIAMAAFVGCQRAVQNIQNKEIYNVSGESAENFWDRMVGGAIAEAAFAKHLNLYWWKGNRNEPDVGDFEVRATPYASGDLHIKPNDPEGKRFYLLTGAYGTYKIRGWFTAEEAKKHPEWLYSKRKDRPIQYWIPQEYLHD